MKYFLTLLFAVNMLFAGSLSAAEHGKGLKRDPEKFQSFLSHATRRAPRRFTPTNIPAYGDLSSVATLARNQGGCGSCWAYALTKALESEYLINKVPVPGLLDTAYLIGNCGGPVREYGCGGGDFPAGQNFLNQLGPWGNGVDPAGSRCKNLPAVATAKTFTVLGEDGTPPSDLDMIQAMSEKHVLVIDIAADNSWGNYPSGAPTMDINGRTVPVWNRNTSSSIDHMINRVGWFCKTTTPDGKFCAFDAKGLSAGVVYLDMNNWGDGTDGAEWGTKAPNGHVGYIYETRLANRAGETAAYFTINTPTPPAPLVPTCTLKVIPEQVAQGDQAAATLSSVNAVSATVDGKAANVNGTVSVDTSGVGFYSSHAEVVSSDGTKGACDANYTVLPAPGPAPVNNSMPVWGWIVMGLVFAGFILVAVLKK